MPLGLSPEEEKEAREELEGRKGKGNPGTPSQWTNVKQRHSAGTPRTGTKTWGETGVREGRVKGSASERWRRGADHG